MQKRFSEYKTKMLSNFEEVPKVKAKREERGVLDRAAVSGGGSRSSGRRSRGPDRLAGCTVPVLAASTSPGAAK